MLLPLFTHFRALTLPALFALSLVSCRQEPASPPVLSKTATEEVIPTVEPPVPPASVEALQFASAQALKDFFRWQPEWKPLISAHRGGFGPGWPENCLESMEHTLQMVPNAILEIDVERTADGQLVILHDNTLDRTTTGKGPVSQKTWAELQTLFLKDPDGKVTSYRIPTLEQVLRWGRGKTVFTVDVKKEVPFEEVIQTIRQADAAPYSAIITYTTGASKKVYRLAPDLMQTVTIRNADELERTRESGVPFANIIAFVGTAHPEAAHYQRLHQEGVTCILGTLGNLDRSAKARGDQIYLNFIADGANILATDRPKEAFEMLKQYQPVAR